MHDGVLWQFFHVAHVFSQGISSVISQFENINPYHWPGYFNASLAVVIAGVVLVIFREVRPPSKWSQFKLNFKIHCLSDFKMTTQLSSKWKTQFVVSCKGY